MLIFACTAGTCLNLVGKSHRVIERITALQSVDQGTESLWSNPHRCRAIELLQDRA
jgi:hypothetical protein